MRRDKFEEFLYLVCCGDQFDGDGGNIGILIFKECMEGCLLVRVFSFDEYVLF